MDSRHIIEIVDKNLAARMDLSRNYSDKELKELIDDCLDNLEKRVPMIGIDRVNIRNTVYNSRRRFGLIQPYLEDSTVNEIMINGTDAIFIEQNGELKKVSERFDDREKLFNLIQSMISWVNRSVNESTPIVDARLTTGARINVVLPPVALNGPIVTIRKFAEKPFGWKELTENGTMTEAQAEYLKNAVHEHKNIIVGGGTSTGKTTFLNMLASEIPAGHRIITVEDSAELRLDQDNVVRLETRNANSEGRGEIKMRSLIKTALRMRPDNILIGEVRDESALEMLTALCTGHRGCMSTAHANSAKDMLVRLETMALWAGSVSSETIRKMIVSGIHLFVHLIRDEQGRRVSEICETAGLKDSEVSLKTVIF
ncbi:MAG: CpaF family protein [Clostridia bacterium]|nr:CpaF family protein [Clostridia bacterium]